MSTHRHNPIDADTPEAIVEPRAESTSQALEGSLIEMGPWMVSLLFHLGVIILALFLVWATIVVPAAEPADPVSIDALKPTNEPTLDPSHSLEFKDTPVQRDPSPEQFEAEFADPVQVVRHRLTDTIGAGPKQDLSKIMRGTPTGGDDSIFVDPPRGPDRPGRIVFVIDASGSVIDGFEFVINELRTTIHKLDEDQKFSVVFFQRGFAMEAAPGNRRGMQPATLERKIAVSDWITPTSGHISPSGSSDPRPALKLAFAYKPDLIYILSDNITGSGEYALDRADLLKDIDTYNAAPGGKRGAAIHTIQFLYPDPLGTLKDVAGRHGGTHRFVRESDLRGVRLGPGA